MRKLITLFFLIAFLCANSQNKFRYPVVIDSAQTNNGNPSSPKVAFEVRTVGKGSLLATKMTTAQMNSIAAPPQALVVYNTDSSKYCYYTGSTWIVLGGSGVSGSAAGSDTWVQYNDGGAFGSDSDFVRNLVVPFTFIRHVIGGDTICKIVSGKLYDLDSTLSGNILLYSKTGAESVSLSGAMDGSFFSVNGEVSGITTFKGDSTVYVIATTGGIRAVAEDVVAGTATSALMGYNSYLLTAEAINSGYNTAILGDTDNIVITSATDSVHSNIVVGKRSITNRIGSYTEPRSYFDLTNAGFSTGNGIGGSAFAFTNEVKLIYGLDSGAVFTGKDISSPILTLKDSSEKVVARFYADGSARFVDGNEASGKVWRCDATGLGNWADPSAFIDSLFKTGNLNGQNGASIVRVTGQPDSAGATHAAMMSVQTDGSNIAGFISTSGDTGESCRVLMTFVDTLTGNLSTVTVDSNGIEIISLYKPVSINSNDISLGTVGNLGGTGSQLQIISDTTNCNERGIIGEIVSDSCAKLSIEVTVTSPDFVNGVKSKSKLHLNTVIQNALTNDTVVGSELCMSDSIHLAGLSVAMYSGNAVSMLYSADTTTGKNNVMQVNKDNADIRTRSAAGDQAQIRVHPTEGIKFNFDTADEDEYTFPLDTAIRKGQAMTATYNGSWQMQWTGGAIKDSIAVTGETVILTNNATTVIVAVGAITDETWNFPSGTDGDYIIVNHTQTATTVNLSGTGTATISASKQTLMKTASSTRFDNFGGNWY